MRTLKISLLLFCIPFMLFAQQTGTLTGKIIDKTTKEYLTGVNVQIKGTLKGAVSDYNGLFEIDNIAVGEHTLIFSSIGYETFTKKSTGTSQ